MYVRSSVKALLLMWVLIPAALTCAAARCGLMHSDSQDKPTIAEDDIREAVFRYQFSHNASAQQQQAGVYFLSVGRDEDPSGEFMDRFKGHRPPVERVSQASTQAGGVADKKTGRRGIIFRVTDIKWISENEAEVEGGYLEGSQSASSNVYRVRFERDGWVVIEDRLKRIA